jgi:pyridoxamine 5'-phosphate oxidase
MARIKKRSSGPLNLPERLDRTPRSRTISRMPVPRLLIDCPLHADPFKQFHEWFGKAQRLSPNTANVIALATANRRGIPSVRYVLFKGIISGGFSFFTHYASRKARELTENPNAAIAFYWHRMQKQVRVEGKIIKLSSAESKRYFQTRPREKQIGAWASPQSDVIPSRDDLEARIRQMEDRFEGRDVPLPPYWGGYALIPQSIEFWLGHHFRWHDRFVYSRRKNSWSITRLAP